MPDASSVNIPADAITLSHMDKSIVVLTTKVVAKPPMDANGQNA